MKFRVRPTGHSSAEKAVANGWTPVALYAQPGDTSAMTAGGKVLTQVRQAHLQPPPAAWDLVTIALSAIIADAATPRDASPDGWTRTISLDLALMEPTVWQPHLPLLSRALEFLTTDQWDIDVTTTASVPYTPPKEIWTPEADCVALLSGGLDSLVGGIDLVDDGRRPFFVSQLAQGDAANQQRFARRINPDSHHLQLNHNANTAGYVTSDERTQRARSLIFIAYGVLVASTVPTAAGQPVDLYVNENGYISINPPLTPMRVGSLSTRTAHPRFLGLVQELFDAVGLSVRITNPYRTRTKGQMLVECLDQHLLLALASDSTSCGRYLRWNYQHCGRCIPCQVRRAAFLHWEQTDDTGYVFDDLGRKDEDHAGFDDVRSVALARLTAAEDGLDYWLGSSLSWVPDAERAATASMLADGLAELGKLHEHYAVT